MHQYENTNFWQRAFGPQQEHDAYSKQRERLRSSLETFRKRSAFLAQQIQFDLPGFTEHGITHIDALWDTAQLVCGRDYELTPSEVYVLAGAFFVHDLGLATAAYPNGVQSMKQHPAWLDKYAALKRQKQHESAEPLSANDEEKINREATQDALRQLHAEQAEYLATTSWPDAAHGGVQLSLITDDELRVSFGATIGKVAHSHWLYVNQLPAEFPTPHGAAGYLPSDWTVDPLKLACIMRAADAAHLDSRRAPLFAQALRKPSGVSRDHWIFQGKLNQPQIVHNLLRYTSQSAFDLLEVNAWWQCFDALRMVNNELEQIDALLSETGKPIFAARGVTNASEPKQLAKIIQTRGWVPVDTQIKVTAVSALVQSLGGRNLYGDNPLVPLRELIQNASDAVRARRLLENRPNDWGSIIVRIGKDEEGDYIEVEDSGVGMSANVLTGPFIDFGNSFWGSDLMHSELPTIESKGFRSTGQFGIGFYSAFMWGSHVKVTTMRCGTSQSDNLILDFASGTTSRPLLRDAQASERILDGGTRVRVWLANMAQVQNAALSDGTAQIDWKTRCEWMCPSLDVDIYVETMGANQELAVRANDWLSMPAKDLLIRCLNFTEEQRQRYDTKLDLVSANIRNITNADGSVIGRSMLYPKSSFESTYMDDQRHKDAKILQGDATVGGFSGSRGFFFLGVLLGEVARAARDYSIPIANRSDLTPWFAEQALLLRNLKVHALDVYLFSQLLWFHTRETMDLPVAYAAGRWLSYKDTVNLAAQLDEFVLIDTFSIASYNNNTMPSWLPNNVIMASQTLPYMSFGQPVVTKWPKTYSLEHVYVNKVVQTTLTFVVIRAAAEAWGTDVDLLLHSYSNVDKNQFNFVFGNVILGDGWRALKFVKRT